tara:strand:+ start:2621 stop:2977 length:357 start_codon:yes stop_codon:yes gene_type:complete
MTKIQGSKDCGNSPKNKFAQDVAIALESGKADAEIFSEDVVWSRSIDSPTDGRDEIMKYLASQAKPAEITVDHAVSHGKVGAASGEVVFANGHRRRFCHVLEFTSAKANCVSVVQSYS